LPVIITEILAAAQAGLAIYQKATAAFSAVKTNLSTTDIATAQAQLDALHKQYEADYASAVTSLQAAAAKS